MTEEMGELAKLALKIAKRKPRNNLLGIRENIETVLRYAKKIGDTQPATIVAIRDRYKFLAEGEMRELRERGQQMGDEREETDMYTNCLRQMSLGITQRTAEVYQDTCSVLNGELGLDEWGRKRRSFLS